MHSSEVFGKLFPTLHLIGKHFQNITILNDLQGHKKKKKKLVYFKQLITNLFSLLILISLNICVKPKSMICLPSFHFGH